MTGSSIVVGSHELPKVVIKISIHFVYDSMFGDFL